MENKESSNWTTEETKKSFEKFYNKSEYYFWYLIKPEHDIVREKRKELKGNLVFCEYGQVSKHTTGFYDKINKIIYKIDNNYENTWIKPKFAVLIKYHNLMSI